MAKRSRSASISPFEDDSLAYTLFRSASSAEPTEHTHKFAQIDEPEDDMTTTSTMRCFLPPHKPLSFSSHADYETHYNASHSNRCSDCHHNFPTAHFLDLHIVENHDPITLAKRERGDRTFACFVDGCDKLCSDWKKRRSHLVDKHGFPRNYDFLVVNSGVDRKKSMLRPGVDAEGHRASSRERKGSTDVDDAATTPSTEATSASPPPASFFGSGGQSNATRNSPISSDASNPPWRGKKRSATRNSIGGPVGGPLVTPAKTDMDDIVNSMSAMKMVPRSVQRKNQAQHGRG